MEQFLPCGQNPDVLDPDLPDKMIKEMCNKQGVPFVALKKHIDISDYKEHEVHWNERGHQRIAEVFFRLYQNHVLMSKMTPTRNSQGDRR
jgi:hypothetical protein